MKRCNEIRCALLGAMALLAGCASAPPAPRETPAPLPGTVATPAPASAPASTPAPESAVPAAARAQYEVALGLMRRERYADAAVTLEAMTRSFPELIGPWLNLAIAQQHGGKGVQAEQTLRDALTHDPRSKLAWNQLGLLQREAGRFAEARESYGQALAIDAGYADARLNLAILYDLYLQQPRDALTQYELYRGAGGDDPNVEHWIADLRKRLGQSPQPAAQAREAAQPAAGATP